MQLNFDQILLQPGHNLLLKNVDWATFEALMEELGDERTARVSYSGGILEIMTPLAVHEIDKALIGDLIKILLEEMNVDFCVLGSTTFKNADMAQAVEPDDCFYIEHEAAVRGKDRIDLTIDPPPDLALEIDITTRTHFDNYQKLGVPELWRYNGRTLEINVLKEGRYAVSATSRWFPDLPLCEVIPAAVAKSRQVGRNAVMREFRQWVRERLGS
jgi:Uma2 family endonuclease